MKAPFIADLQEVKDNPVGEVLAPVALEFNGAVPQVFGGKPAVPRDDMLELRTSTSKAELIAAACPRHHREPAS